MLEYRIRTSDVLDGIVKHLVRATVNHATQEPCEGRAAVDLGGYVIVSFYINGNRIGARYQLHPQNRDTTNRDKHIRAAQAQVAEAHRRTLLEDCFPIQVLPS